MDTMEWLWIPAVALVAVFIFALCWLFFKDYTCCPCRNTRLQSNDVESGGSRSGSRSVSSFTAIDISAPCSLPLPRTYPTPSTYSVESCSGRSIPTRVGFHKPQLRSLVLPPEPPPQPPKRLIPQLTTLIDYDFGDDVDTSDIVRMQLGAPTIDLHQLTVKEAMHVTKTFLKQSRGKYRKLRIITGRGLHSANGVPKIKPAVESLLNEWNYSFKETAKGGCLEVAL
ncbi:uncharacterized protein LOC123501386 [Portunus trituberculatus]|uniref:uncharacterized protein LOC123501386 n=1 Tax=Portunus trituberculatus TaxID=210409 RepID=UPI001E1D0B2A|nr:uncharacterized protein LOC123501386 [Portunus trituberculatus]XP_045106134.1 uncharacterized protein LOC123501386 [Portunus trituberculatus]XP_045106135.1 uncharacterized protein LOC123501386 [Portunus trituberculatus]XP_045106136.1 uncharacterized protein LOC123501386 [Portunus trituberculatus]XP_045106138.1 uncharacterized protein LOC123501386 [Portunus trituberculatus]XP_045106139.1 uncharacterized protein LOC123501386 [Portunus trituberculatus]XP_045106140.1 uncharacterized protein LO